MKIEGEHQGFTQGGILARDIASGKAAKEELFKLKQIIRYMAEKHPAKHSVIIEIDFIANTLASNFGELLEKYAEVTCE